MMIKAAWMRAMPAAAVGLCIGFGVCGCKKDANVRGFAVRPVTVEEFARPGEGGSSPRAAATQPLAVNRIAPAASDGIISSSATVAEAPAAGNGARALRPGEQVVIESVIGQVSGRPIFADALLEPIADLLRQESEQSAPREFEMKAARIVADRVNQVVLNELFLAESEAALTTEQQQGLLGFIGQLREKTVAEAFGSLSQREKELQEERGMTLDEYMQLRKNETLVRTLLNQKVEPRVIVSWRDVQREYERRKAEFNPPASVTLSRVRLGNTDQKELIEQITTRLANGESFDAVAATLEPSLVRTLEPLPMASDDVSDIQIAPAVKPYLKGLREGQTSQAIVEKDDTTWWHVVKIDQAPTKTLYDVQRQLNADLDKRRQNEQLDRYIKSLLEKGNYDQIDEMSRRVLRVAVLRYGK